MPKPRNNENTEEVEIVPHQNVIQRDIVAEMEESYIDYAMSVITDRALPDIRDGLKPVQRRILFAMSKLGLLPTAKFQKSAKVVGETMGNYHPHGDAAIYQTMVNMVQDFNMRYPLVWGQGNFGNIDGYPAAASRYTESKLNKISVHMLGDLEKDTVDFRPNYDGTRKEPSVLPTMIPNFLLNGTLGIAVGMATNIPPHNLNEVMDAVNHLVDNPEATVSDLIGFVKGPDFPTGAIAFNQKDIEHALTHGRGGVVVRGEAEIVEEKAGQSKIIINSIPYRVNKSSLIEAIADLVRDKKLEGIKDIRDESTSDVRIVVELKNGMYPQNILNYLYKHTQLESTFHYNLVALVDGVPQTLSLKSALENFVDHRKIVIRRRTEFDLRKAEDREHILLGLKKALDHIDEIIAIIKKSKDTPAAHIALMKEFKFSDRQTTAILEMKLARLASLERKKIEDELHALQAIIKDLKDILKNPARILAIIKDESNMIKEKFGDERRTRIVKGGVANVGVEDVIPDQESVLVLTAGGYIKRTNPDEFKKQKRGGVGVVDVDLKEEDFITHLVSATLHNELLFFTDKGKAYQIKMYDIPEGKRATRGKSIMNFLSLAQDEKVTSILPMPKEVKKVDDVSLMLITKLGTGKRVGLNSFKDVRRSGIIAISLDDGDSLISASFVNEKDSMILVATDAQSIRFSINEIREMGRSAGGVRAMKIDKGVAIIGAIPVRFDSKDDAELLTVSANGYGKKTSLSEYKIQGRGGSGIKTFKVTDKTGDLIASQVVTPELDEIVAISKKSQVIRCELKEIPNLGRDTQGVRVMKLREGDSLASVIGV
ncbi:DNA gyrase subunit A [Candidatus Parcubacteria bacterium]|nr:DNA gyrase subunit A [Candidatus Parcubacteria bacterium]